MDFNSFISTMFGGACVLIGTLINGHIQYIINERKTAHEKELHEKDLLFEKNKEIALAKGKIYKIAHHLKLDSSLARNYILEDIGATEKDIHKMYIEQYHLLSEALSLCLIYFPELMSDFKELSQNINLIWGNRQNYFRDSKNNEADKNKLRLTLIDLFNFVEITVREIENKLLKSKSQAV